MLVDNKDAVVPGGSIWGLGCCGEVEIVEQPAVVPGCEDAKE